jgi:hypothetical protein
LTVRESDIPLHEPGRRPSPAYALAALAIGAVVVTITIVVTRDAAVVTAVTSAVLLLLGWFATTLAGRRDD